MILRELDVDVMPLLTGAGIVGLAVGFGAQTLLKDLIPGFFLILDNQVRVGDVARINGTGGLVDAISLRTVVLRDLAGTVHIFPTDRLRLWPIRPRTSRTPSSTSEWPTRRMSTPSCSSWRGTG